MKVRFALAFVVAFTSGAALAADWQAPEDGKLTAQHVEDFVTYTKALKKVGGDWYHQTSYVLSDVEKRALNEAALDRLEIDWSKPRILYIARLLAIETATAETWEKAEKRANEKLAAAKKKIDDLTRNGPKEIAELDDVVSQLEKTDRELADEFVEKLILSLKLGEAEKRHDAAAKTKDLEKMGKTSDEIEALRAKKNKVEDHSIELARQSDQLRRRQLEINEKLDKVGAADGKKTVALAAEARRDLEEVEAAKADKAAGKKVDSVLDPSVAAVKAKLGDVERALGELGSPVFGAVAPKEK